MWQIFIDTGGTFTDCIAISPAEKTFRTKVLSSGKLRARIATINKNTIKIEQKWNCSKDIFAGYKFRPLSKADFVSRVKQFDADNSILHLDDNLPPDLTGTECEIWADEEAPVLACRLLTQTPLNQSLPQIDLRLGSTKGTNALLERKGTPPVLFVTKGFADMLVIGNQQRNKLFALKVEKPQMYYKKVVEIDERISSEGTILKNADSGAIEIIAKQLKQEGTSNVAISLLNAYQNPAHEQQIEQILKDNGIRYISVSSKIERSINYLSRTQTTVVNAYLQEVIDSYISNIKSKLPEGSLFKVMTSAGGLAQHDRFFPKDSLLSGPAGGVVGTASIAQQTSSPNVLAFDMGGTSTDVSRYSQRFDYQYQTSIGDASIMSPAIYIETIAAGGGSICSFDGNKFTVGPHSAGASPGPACYGNGGPLTITDVNLLLGRIPSAKFRIPLNKTAAQQAFNLFKHTHRLEHLADEDILEGFLRIANEMMAEAIRKISISKGYSAADYKLMAFGGAGAMHACAIADILGISQTIIPYDAGILSAAGIGSAFCEHFENRQILKLLDEAETELPQIIDEAERAACSALISAGISADNCQVRERILRIRCKGQDFCIELDYSSQVDIREAYKSKYQALFGYWSPNQTLEIESLKIIASETRANTYNRKPQSNNIKHKQKLCKQNVYINNCWENIAVYNSDNLSNTIDGPALVANDNCTIYIANGWEATSDEFSNLHLSKTGESETVKTVAPEVELELFTRRFESIVNDMGALLQRSAFSVNIKERMDFSCALLDAKGMLVANAPHIPVHLGALGICCRSLINKMQINEGDVIITNHPAYGGSHLPDITLIAPVHFHGKLIGFVANRAHHAELGGISPGSMPANAANLEEEGVVITPFKIIEKGVSKFGQFKTLLESAKYPSRSPNDNIADINAAIASIRTGTEALVKLCVQESPEKACLYMEKLSNYSILQLRKSLKKFDKAPLSATELLDDGSKICVSICMKKDMLHIDFSGTGAQRTDNLNATPAIVNSAILYVLRLCIEADIPMNEGVLQMLAIHNPHSMLNPDFSKQADRCPPVVGGNVETSQRIVDCLLKALSMSACSQGTMNNLIFGNDTFGYYETICGGTGAGKGFNGADAVHQHMTNTRITDAEVLELRYPVRLLEFSIRQNSGGEGKWKGGNGCTRKLQFLEPVQLTLLSQHRVTEPYGMLGGGNGKTGKQSIAQSNGEPKQLSGTETVWVNAGDIFTIMTPGGGAWGKQE